MTSCKKYYILTRYFHAWHEISLGHYPCVYIGFNLVGGTNDESLSKFRFFIPSYYAYNDNVMTMSIS